MGIEKKSIGIILDELFTTNIKCFMAQEIIMKSKEDSEVAKAARDAQTLNRRRNQLIKVIDEYFEDENSPTTKTY